jgi:hypothetical protein
MLEEREKGKEGKNGPGQPKYDREFFFCPNFFGGV